MKIKNWMFFAALLTGTVLCGSCEKESLDGAWSPLNLTVNDVRCKDGIYHVQTEGGVYNLCSKTYGSLWLNAIVENGEEVWPENDYWDDFIHIDLKKEWYAVHYDDAKGSIVVSIEPLAEGDDARSLTFYVEYGDAFGRITFEQK